MKCWWDIFSGMDNVQREMNERECWTGDVNNRLGSDALGSLYHVMTG